MGQIVGTFIDPTNRYHGFLATGGSFTTIDVPGPTTTYAFGVNDTGQIVGVFIDGTGNHGFVATPIMDTTPPVIRVSATPATLWPPNGKMISVTIAGTITDAGSGVNGSTATYAVTDEYGSVQPSGHATLGQNGSYTFTIQLQASRNGNDKNGRQYIITVSAQDNAGNTGSSSTIVTAPHDQGH